MNDNIIWFKDCSYSNKNLVGGKCSSLGELYHLSKKIDFAIADGFAITTNVYREFIHYNNLDSLIELKLNDIDTSNIKELEEESDKLRKLIIDGTLSDTH